jgi:arylsulfatase
VDGEQCGSGRVEATVPLAFSADETCDLGADSATPVSDDYTAVGSVFSGRVRWVQIDLGENNEGHLITPEQRLAVAMTRQ